MEIDATNDEYGSDGCCSLMIGWVDYLVFRISIANDSWGISYQSYSFATISLLLPSSMRCLLCLVCWGTSPIDLVFKSYSFLFVALFMDE